MALCAEQFKYNSASGASGRAVSVQHVVKLSFYDMLPCMQKAIFRQGKGPFLTFWEPLPEAPAVLQIVPGEIPTASPEGLKTGEDGREQQGAVMERGRE